MKKLLLKSMLLLCALVVGSMNGWANTATITFASQTSGTSDGSSAYTTSNFVSNGIASSSAAFGTITCSATAKCYSGKTGYGLKAGGSSNASSFTISFSTALTNVSQITLNRASYSDSKTATITVKNGTTTLANAVSTPSSSAEFADMDITGLSIASLAELTVETSKYCYIKSITITYTPSATPTCAAPTFSPAAGAVLSGTEVTLSTTTEGATIYYTMGNNPADPTSASTAYDSNNKPTITAATTIKAIAIKAGSNNSTVSSASYTIATPFANIAALTADATASPKTGFVTLSGAIVTFVSGNNAYLQDASGAVLFYKSGHGLTAGKVLTGTAAVTYKLNSGNPQITDLSGITPAAGSAPDPTSVAQSAWNYTFTNVLNKYFQITGATLTKTNNKYYVQLGSDNVQLFKSGGSISDLNLSKKYTITGFPLFYSTTKELQIYADPIEEATTDPLIDASDVTIEFDATSGQIPYTIENQTSATLIAAITNGDWISNLNVATDKVTFTATANTGAQRTATITLSYTGADNRVITVTQKKYGIATLPFTFDGGKSDIESTTSNYGLSHTGLGSDYSGSPKLKFDDTGDHVVLRFNEEPGILSFSIKGNGFSSGSTSTFTVQTSENGTSYSDLDEYTELGDTEIKTYKLGSSVRYVKWIYTEKGATSGGNVALGNICLALPGEPSIPVVSGTTVTLTTSTNMAGWRTYDNNTTKKYTVDGTTKVYYASATTDNKVTLTEIAGGVPANTAVILHQTNGSSITLTETSNAITAPGESNKLAVSTAGQDLGKVFRLGYKSGSGKGVGFYSYTTASAPAGIIYVSSITAGARDYLEFSFEDETTGVKEVKAQKVDGEYYNLAGQRVAQPTKGLYIVNGKKVIMK